MVIIVLSTRPWLSCRVRIFGLALSNGLFGKGETGDEGGCFVAESDEGERCWAMMKRLSARMVGSLERY